MYLPYQPVPESPLHTSLIVGSPFSQLLVTSTPSILTSLETYRLAMFQHPAGDAVVTAWSNNPGQNLLAFEATHPTVRRVQSRQLYVETTIVPSH